MHIIQTLQLEAAQSCVRRFIRAYREGVDLEVKEVLWIFIGAVIS